MFSKEIFLTSRLSVLASHFILSSRKIGPETLSNRKVFSIDSKTRCNTKKQKNNNFRATQMVSYLRMTLDRAIKGN